MVSGRRFGVSASEQHQPAKHAEDQGQRTRFRYGYLWRKNDVANIQTIEVGIEDGSDQVARRRKE